MAFKPAPTPGEMLPLADAIGMNEASDSFGATTLQAPAEGAVTVRPLSYSLTYLIPGMRDPRLRRMIYLPNNFSREVRDASHRSSLEEVSLKSHGLGNNGARLVTEQVSAACETLEVQEDIRDEPFVVVGMLAVYQTDVNLPFAAAFTSHRFVDTLAEQMEPSVAEEEMPEEIHQGIYARQAEHDPTIAPYPEWMSKRMTAFQDGSTEEERRRHAAMGWIELLILPRDITHPLFNIKLFKS
jgi:hypothetical protein